MKLNPSDMDMARDVRRFWWVIPPFLLAGVLYVVLGFTESPEAGGRTDPAGAIVREYTAHSTPSISVHGVVGDIRVETTTNNRVSITVTANGSGFGAEDAFRELNSHVEIANTGDNLDVRVSYVGEGPRAHLGADVVVRAPAGSNVDIETNDGAIMVKDVAGDIRATTRTGNITVTLPAGRPFNVAGDGRLLSDFPLTIATQTSYYLREGAQSLVLRAPAGTVQLRRD